MRLLRAELRKLRRPLTAWVFGLGALLAVLLAWGGLVNTHAYLSSPRYRAPAPLSCAQAGLAEGPACRRRLASYRELALAAERSGRAASLAAARRDAAQDVYVTGPVGAGAMAAGLTASLPGLVLIALLAAGHVGGEWTGRTLTTVLAVEGRRHRVLAAKAASLWLAAVALCGTLWAALAVTGPVWRAAFPLPVRHPGLAAQWRHTWPLVAHALLTLAVFALLAVAAAVLTRSVVGTLAGTVGTAVAGLVAAGFPAVTDWTPGTWVAAWTRFPAQADVVTSYWSRLSAPDARQAFRPAHLGPLAALGCLAGCAAVCWLAAVAGMRRMDVN